MRLSPTIGWSLMLLTSPCLAWAHESGQHQAPSFGLLVKGWTSDPATLVPLIVATVWYLIGMIRARYDGKSRVIPRKGPLCFAAAMIVLVIALQSPIDTISEDLFSVHMVQHLLLMLAAPPLLVLSGCAIMYLRALPRSARKSVARFWSRSEINYLYDALMHPLLVWTLFCGAFVFWHSPGPYQWALDDERVHIVEHLSFFLTSLAFWSIVLAPRGTRRRLQYGPTLLFVVSTAVLSGLPGALMIFSPRPLYPGHAEGVAKWGLTLMEDQQIAGLIMWIPAGAAYILAVVVVFLEWMKEAEARAIRAARRGLPLILVLSVLSPLLIGCDEQDGSGLANFSGDAHRGALLVKQYGCGGCHSIPGISEADGNVGPPLMHIGTRSYLAGVLNNSPENMSRWIQDPQKVLPGNAMPTMNISQSDARDITAFLHTLK
ncbi:MAG TPA: cytochrome c oxidase assembly protein [Bradyrhizobium sp.]|nr:cytochrome c oxidase assembly protein [Bradyrhizobium sp.]